MPGKPGAQTPTAKAKQGQGRPVVCVETGKVYANANAAARALGISYGGANLGVAARNGGTVKGYHWRYQDEPEREPGQIRGNRSVVCWETDEVFETAEAAAAWAGTDINGIYASLNLRCSSGGYHWYLYGTPKPDASVFKTGRAVVCWETGVEYPSINAAAHAVGLKTGAHICEAIRTGGTSGGYHWYYKGAAKPDASELKSKRKRPVICWETGEEFENTSAAAEAVGLKSTSCIQNALKKGVRTGGYHWYYKGDPKPETFPETKKGRKPRAVVCYETGETFESTKRAAEAVGLKGDACIRAVLRGDRPVAGGFHWYVSGQPRPDASELKQGRRKRPVACWETDEVFANAKEAAAAVGIARAASINTAVRMRSRVGGYHWYRLDQPKPKESELKQTKWQVRRKPE